MAAGGLDGLEGAGQDPLLESGVTDAEGGSGFAGFEQDVYCDFFEEGKSPYVLRKIVM
jgi:hypothetical protein